MSADNTTTNVPLNATADQYISMVARSCQTCVWTSREIRHSRVVFTPWEDLTLNVSVNIRSLGVWTVQSTTSIAGRACVLARTADLSDVWNILREVSGSPGLLHLATSVSQAADRTGLIHPNPDCIQREGILLDGEFPGTLIDCQSIITEQPIRERVVWMLDLAKGAFALCSRSAVLSHMTPQDVVMVTRGGTVKAEFSNFQRLIYLSDATPIVLLLQCPAYLIPPEFADWDVNEQLTIEQLEKVTVYQLGELFHYILTGNLSYTGNMRVENFVFPPETEIANTLITETQQVIRRNSIWYTPAFPGSGKETLDIDHIVLKMLARNPADRPTLQEVIGEVGEWLASSQSAAAAAASAAAAALPPPVEQVAALVDDATRATFEQLLQENPAHVLRQLAAKKNVLMELSPVDQSSGGVIATASCVMRILNPLGLRREVARRVNRAEDVETSRKVVVIRPCRASLNLPDALRQARLLHLEHAMLCQLADEPNVVALDRDGCLFPDKPSLGLITSFYPDGDLIDFMASASFAELPVVDKLRASAELVDQVLRLHDELRIIHYDLKLDNILVQFVGGRLTLKIADWEFARRAPGVEAIQTVRGTPLSLPPNLACALFNTLRAKEAGQEIKIEDELIRIFDLGDMEDWEAAEYIGKYQDRYALGCILYRLVYGREVPWVFSAEIDNIGKPMAALAQIGVSDVDTRMAVYPEPDHRELVDHAIWSLLVPDHRAAVRLDIVSDAFWRQAEEAAAAIESAAGPANEAQRGVGGSTGERAPAVSLDDSLSSPISFQRTGSLTSSSDACDQ